MDYDRFDALLHHIFKQTQGDAWFRPNESTISSGVAVRTEDGSFRIFPYEVPSLEPFEQAVQQLNPAVAVKTRSAAVHAALANLANDVYTVYVDGNTKIQILDNMSWLPQADREQGAAFIRDERVFIVWSDSLDSIIPTCQDFEERLIKLLWRSRTETNSPVPREGSISAHTSEIHAPSDFLHAPAPTRPRSWFTAKFASSVPSTPTADATKAFIDHTPSQHIRKPALYAAFYNGLAAALSIYFVASGIKTLISETLQDGNFIRFALLAVVPPLFCVSLFFSLQIIQTIAMVVGPIAHIHQNSTTYSAIPPPPCPDIEGAKGDGGRLPHITIQMPVYKESLELVLTPSILSLKKAMQTYARQGGTSSILVCEDGMRTFGEAQTGDRDERIAFYAQHNIAWVARPRQGASKSANFADSEKAYINDPEKGVASSKSASKDASFQRRGRFKKASNMNYALDLSLKVEKHLEKLLASRASSPSQLHSDSNTHTPPLPPKKFHFADGSVSSSHRNSQVDSIRNASTWKFKVGGSGMQYMGKDGDDMNVGLSASPSRQESSVEDDDDEISHAGLEDMALSHAIKETHEETGYTPWAANAKNMRIGELILLVDSDTLVPEDCLLSAAREFHLSPSLAILQHESGVLQVANHYFENGIAYFTRRINRSIGFACANGELAPFVGHNAFLRWKSLQDVTFYDSVSGKERIWSEDNVSEDFDLAMRLLKGGWGIRWATYSNHGFKEGVSLTVDDELNRWMKYSFGVSELLFNPFISWFRRGPISHQIHNFVWAKSVPFHYKISNLAYMFSYYGIAASFPISIINYVLLGFMFPVDQFYRHSFEIWLATTVIFFGAGNVGYTLLEYRAAGRPLIKGFLENLMWIPFFFFFFGGLSIPLTQAILAHMFSYNISWSATVKEVHRSNFFMEIPKIVRRFWFPLIVSILVIVGVVICSTTLVPLAWQIGSDGWAVIFPVVLIASCHILFPIVLNPWLMVFSY